MPASAQRRTRRRSARAAAATLTLAALVAVIAGAPAHAGGSCQPAIQAAAELSTGGLPDNGLPPSPGPTNPDGAS